MGRKNGEGERREKEESRGDRADGSGGTGNVADISASGGSSPGTLGEEERNRETKKGGSERRPGRIGASGR